MVCIVDANRIEDDEDIAIAIDVRNNSLVCDEAICWLLQPSTKSIVWVSAHACNEPLEMSSVNWIDIIPSEIGCGKCYGTL